MNAMADMMVSGGLSATFGALEKFTNSFSAIDTNVPCKFFKPQREEG